MAKKPQQVPDVLEEIQQEAKALLERDVPRPDKQLCLFEEFADYNNAPKKNPKTDCGLTWSQEIFCQLVARGYSKVESYQKSHPACKTENLNTVYPKASRLAKTGKVGARIEQIRKKLEERSLMSPSEVCQRLTELARKGGKDGFEALVKIAQIHGLFKPEKEMVQMGPSVIVQTVDYSKVNPSSTEKAVGTAENAKREGE